MRESESRPKFSGCVSRNQISSFVTFPKLLGVLEMNFGMVIIDAPEVEVFSRESGFLIRIALAKRSELLR